MFYQVMCRQCESLYCAQCVRDKIESCPQCRYVNLSLINDFDDDEEDDDDNDQDKWFTRKIPKFIIKFLNNLIIKCNNEDCDQNFQYERYMNHQSECDYLMVECKNEQCRLEVRQMDLETHELTCEYEEINCGYCYSKYFLNKLQEHHATCEEYYLSCQYCDEGLPRRSIVAHEQECDLKLIKCSVCERDICKGDQSHHDKYECYQALYQEMMFLKIQEQEKNLQLQNENQSLVVQQYILQRQLIQHQEQSIQEAHLQQLEKLSVQFSQIAKIENPMQSLQRSNSEEAEQLEKLRQQQIQISFYNVQNNEDPSSQQERNPDYINIPQKNNSSDDQLEHPEQVLEDQMNGQKIDEKRELVDQEFEREEVKNLYQFIKNQLEYPDYPDHDQYDQMFPEFDQLYNFRQQQDQFNYSQIQNIDDIITQLKDNDQDRDQQQPSGGQCDHQQYIPNNRSLQIQEQQSFDSHNNNQPEENSELTKSKMNEQHHLQQQQSIKEQNSRHDNHSEDSNQSKENNYPIEPISNDSQLVQKTDGSTGKERLHKQEQSRVDGEANQTDFQLLLDMKNLSL